MFRAAWLCLLICVACRKPQGAAPGPGPAAAQASAETVDAGFVLTPAMLDAYLKYQLASEEGVDGGLLDHARADEALRERSGLSDADLSRIDAMVAAVIARRMVTQLASHGGIGPDLGALGANLNPEQQKRMQDAVAAFKKAQTAATELKDERARFGSANVDVLLSREEDLRKNWEVLMTKMAAPRAP
jgi:hypothetical protein